MRWLAASALLFLIAVQLAPLAESGPDKCKVYKKVQNVQWEKMARKEWLEALHSRSRHPECLSRAYFPKRGRLERRKKRGPHKTVEKSYHPFTVHKGDIFLYRDETQFEQLISTDHRDWALIYHCWPKGSGAHFVLLITRKGGVVTGDMLQKARAALRRAGYHEKITWKHRKSKFALTLREPLSVIPGDIETRVYQTLQRAGVNQDIKWTKSPCMLDRTINAIFPQPPATLYPPPDAVLPYDAEGVPELPLKTEMPPDAGSPLETQAPQEDDMPEKTELPQETGMPEEIGVPQYVTPPPETDGVPGASMAPDTNMPKDIETSQEVSVPPETETATELILVPLTTPWLPYENDEESW
ncbi:hypothetical protein V5799_007730 [Amblyomma americanum]|uniref:Secreted protein n=1 Tax=Amblyomma americanum TaxID=6943 RepID=A0AAQ4FGK6_AMBAM